jgi:hypothetical protein
VKKSMKKHSREKPPETSKDCQAPKKILLKDVLKGVPLDGKLLLGFYISDVKEEYDIYTFKRWKIPRIRLNIKNKGVVDIYGSHLKTKEDRHLTHIVHNPTNIWFRLVREFDKPWPSWVSFIRNSKTKWEFFYDLINTIKGDAEKTSFQGVADDPDLLNVLLSVEEIKKSKETHTEVIVFPGGIRKEVRIGEDLLDFLLPVVRSSNFKKLKLLEKCIKYCDNPPSNTKMSRIITHMNLTCNHLNRLPTPPELLSSIDDSGYEYKDSRFYKDLNDVGLGWLSNKSTN